MPEWESQIGDVYPLAQEVGRALEGAVFPLHRAQLVRIAQENDASVTLLSLLHTLPLVELKTLDEVQRLLAEDAP